MTDRLYRLPLGELSDSKFESIISSLERAGGRPEMPDRSSDDVEDIFGTINDLPGQEAYYYTIGDERVYTANYLKDDETGYFYLYGPEERIRDIVACIDEIGEELEPPV